MIQENQMSSASTARVEFITSSSQNISFLTNTNSFYRLTVNSGKSINIHYDLISTNELMDLTAVSNIDVESNVDIISAGSLTFLANHMYMDGANNFLATHNLTIDTPISILTSNTVTIRSNQSKVSFEDNCSNIFLVKSEKLRRKNTSVINPTNLF